MNSIYKTTGPSAGNLGKPDQKRVAGWVYSVKEHAGPWPAETEWVADGAAEPNAPRRTLDLLCLGCELAKQ